MTILGLKRRLTKEIKQREADLDSHLDSAGDSSVTESCPDCTRSQGEIAALETVKTWLLEKQ